MQVPTLAPPPLCTTCSGGLQMLTHMSTSARDTFSSELHIQNADASCSCTYTFTDSKPWLPPRPQIRKIISGQGQTVSTACLTFQ